MKRKSDNQQSSYSGNDLKVAEYVVGIGASAGGLEALQDFFKAMPLETGLGFVVIQHLSPDYRSLMDELLARYTQIPIKKVKDGMPVEPNTIYLIPPRKNLSIFHGKLLLEEQGARSGLNLPIDIFFRSLAKDYGKKAISIVLSGTGSDGTLGTRAIKEAGGMVMAQDERSAKFDGMPRSTISTGLVDFILPPSKMPEALVNYIKHPLVGQNKAESPILTSSTDSLTKVMMILRDYSGIDFSYYKENTIIRRLERRLSINRFEKLEDYLGLLSESDKEKDILYRELLIGVTRFFRDEEAFHTMSQEILPQLFQNKPRSIRIWSVACSTGEEVYSLAMIIREYIENKRLDTEVKIFATDIDKRSLEIAGQGIYPESIVSDIEPTLLAKYFMRREGGYQVNETLRKMVIFATQNVLKDPPFSKLDLIVCRNLFIYLKLESQTKVLNTFYLALKPGGFLFMGNSESLGSHSEAFQAISTKHKIYSKKSGYKGLPLNKPLVPEFLSSARELDLPRHTAKRNLKQELMVERIFEQLLPPSIVVDENLNILHVINDVNPYLLVKSGKFTQNLQNLSSKEVSVIISNIIRRLKSHKVKVSFENVRISKPDEESYVNITGHLLDLNDDNPLFLIVFQPAGTTIVESTTHEVVKLESQYRDRIGEMQNELQFTKENLQATIEELETSNEELQASNEELIASNEELQSTNEELQSVNEELYTVNSEYQKKIEELIQLNSDVNNLLKNTEVGALYLDRKLCIRKFTDTFANLSNLLDADIGRPIFHISGANLYPHFFDDIRKVQETLMVIEIEHQLNDNKLYIIKISPYRTDYHAIDGVLVTLVNISLIREERYKLKVAAQRLHDALELGNMAWWEWDISTGHVAMHPKKATMLGYTTEEFPHDVYEICKLIHPDDYETVMQHMRDHLEGKIPVYDISYRIRTKSGGYKIYHDRGGVVERDTNGKPRKLVGLVIDTSAIRLPE